MRTIPFICRKIESELSTVRNSLERSIHECDKELKFIKKLPKLSQPVNGIIDTAKQYFSLNQKFDVLKGRVSGAVYTNLAENHLDMLTEVIAIYIFKILINNLKFF